MNSVEIASLMHKCAGMIIDNIDTVCEVARNHIVDSFDPETTDPETIEDKVRHIIAGSLRMAAREYETIDEA